MRMRMERFTYVLTHIMHVKQEGLEDDEVDHIYLIW